MRSFEILLVEDDPDDVELTREALESPGPSVRLFVAVDGVDALAFLRREGAYASVPRPDLILLDLNLPRKSGKEVLAELKADDALAAVPVIVVSTSTTQRDIEESYALQANAYIAKSLDMSEFTEAVSAMRRFWLEAAKLPTS